MAKRRDEFVIALRERFERAIAEGDLASNADPADLARFERVAQIALRAWPV
jgi:hypothetical protein